MKLSNLIKKIYKKPFEKETHLKSFESGKCLVYVLCCSRDDDDDDDQFDYTDYGVSNGALSLSMISEEVDGYIQLQETRQSSRVSLFKAIKNKINYSR